MSAFILMDDLGTDEVYNVDEVDDVQSASAALAALLESSAPEDRIAVLREQSLALFEPLLCEEAASPDVVLGEIYGLATRFGICGPEHSEALREIVSRVAGLDIIEPNDGEIPFDSVQALPPLTLVEWSNRDLLEPDWLLGAFLSTTSRALLAAPTGLGKTNFALALGLRIADGQGFLHWSGSGGARKVLYLDGEMSRRLLRGRLRSEVKRMGGRAPNTFYALCAEDVEDFRPLNTPEGRSYVWSVINKLGGVDLVIFDNIMSLISGSMIEEAPWAEVMPLVRALTQRNVGQLWIHHTGHSDARAYGTKTREWQLDLVAMLEEAKRADTDVSFKLSFTKARERAPWNRNQFQDVEIALVEDAWVYRTESPVAAAKVSPTAERYLQALRDAVASSGGKTADKQAWVVACGQAGLMDLKGKRNVIRANLSKYRTMLVAAGMIATDGELSWPIP